MGSYLPPPVASSGAAAPQARRWSAILACLRELRLLRLRKRGLQQQQQLRDALEAEAIAIQNEGPEDPYVHPLPLMSWAQWRLSLDNATGSDLADLTASARRAADNADARWQ